MFLSRRWPVPMAVAAGFALMLSLPSGALGYIILFKDGFVLRGRIGMHSTVIVDRKARKAFSVPIDSMPYFLEAFTRKILFTPDQVHDVLEEKPSPLPQWMNLRVYGKPRGSSMPVVWKYLKVGDWNSRWERHVVLYSQQGQGRFLRPVHLHNRQRITLMNPEFVQVVSLDYRWVQYYRTKELGLATVRKLLDYYFAKDRFKKMPELEKKVKKAKFLAQCGWLKEAIAEMENIVNAAPAEQKKNLEADLQAMQKALAVEWVKDLEERAKAGQHQRVARLIEEFYAKDLDKIVGTTFARPVFSLRVESQRRLEKVKQARRDLRELVARLPNASQAFFGAAVETILNELNVDTVDRLETFLGIARTYRLAVEAKRKPSLPAEKVLAYALSGWVVDDAGSKDDVQHAVRLWRTRSAILAYQNEKSYVQRQAIRKALEGEGTLGLDVLARIIRNLPPPQPHDKLDTSVQELQAPTRLGGSFTYYVKLPPEYHHYRPHPVLIVLHNATTQSPEQAMAPWQDLAARYGYILAAPVWTVPGQTVYLHSQREHLAVLDTIRDLRRRFQIDSDRVFLTGSQWGGSAAFDIGISHPDQFAGVLPMATWPPDYAVLYWSNAMYLPFYVVDGQLHGESGALNEKLFKRWIKMGYPTMFVQYKGRGREWFGGELPEMFDWMNRKRRVFPLKALGSGIGQRSENAFRSLRPWDNRFYWITIDTLHPRYVRGPGQLKPNMLTATVRAKITSTNEIFVYTSGVRRFTVWIAPGMIDFSRKVTMIVNRAYGRPFSLRPDLGVLLEHLYDHGDRSRLFVARIQLNAS